MNYLWFIGIDISKKTLDVVIYNKSNQKLSHCLKVKNNQQGFKKLLKWLKNNKIIFSRTLLCMEHTGIYGYQLGTFLHGKIDYCFESPLHIKRSLGITRGKNDKVDALKIARFCYLHREELKPREHSCETLQKLRNLFNERERLVKMRTIEKQTLKEYRDYHGKSTNERIESRLEFFTRDIKQIENEIKFFIEQDEAIKQNAKLAQSVTGIGLINTVLFILYTNNFESFTDARKYACYSGIAPFENTSGTSIKGKTRVSHLANKKIKAHLSNASRSAVQNDSEMKIYYKRKEKEGKAHGVIMNAIKFKLITRVFAVVKRGTPYVKMRKAG